MSIPLCGATSTPPSCSTRYPMQVVWIWYARSPVRLAVHVLCLWCSWCLLRWVYVQQKYRWGPLFHQSYIPTYTFPINWKKARTGFQNWLKTHMLWIHPHHFSQSYLPKQQSESMQLVKEVHLLRGESKTCDRHTDCVKAIRGRPLMIWGGAEEIEKKKFRRPFSRKKKILRGTLREKINFERHFPGKNKFWEVPSGEK